MTNNLKKNFTWNLIGSTFNSFTSLFFMIIVTRLNGVDIAGIFTFAFTFAILMQVIGNYFGRSYQVTNPDNNIKDSDFVYSRVLTCLLMLVVALLFVLIKGYSEYKVLVILLLVLFRMVESFGEIIYGVIQKNDKLYQVGISLTLKAVLAVALFFIFDLFTNNLLIALLIIVITHLVIILTYDIKNLTKCNFKFKKLNKDNLTKIMLGGFSVFLFTFFIQYVINASRYSIDSHLADHLQTIYGIIVMPATIMALFSQFLLQPYLNNFTEMLKNNKIKDFVTLTLKLCFCLLIAGIIVLIVCYLIGIPILEFIYGIPLINYKLSFIIIILGSVFFGLTSILSTVLIAMRKNVIQAVIYGIISVITYFICEALVPIKEVFGASLAYLITMIILLIAYILYFAYCTMKIRK